MKTVIDAVNEFKGLGLSAVVGDKYLSSDGVTEKTINTYVHLFACDKEQLNDWSRAYTEFVWRINTGESPNFTGDVEWIDKNGEAHKVSMKTLYWDLDIVKWRPVLKSDKELAIDWSKAPEGATHYDVSPDVYPWIKEDDNGNKFWHHNQWVNYNCPISERDCHIRRPMFINCTSNNESQSTPTFTQEMYDNGVLPSVGMECIAAYCKSEVKVTIAHINSKKQFACIDDNGDYLIHYPKEGIGESFKPLTPPITLIDGNAYQFDIKKQYGNAVDIQGIYSESLLVFQSVGNAFFKSTVTNIQPLTVEAK